MKTKLYILLIGFMCAFSAYAQDSYIGEIKLFAGNYAPQGWALCNGQIIPIAQNQALFAVIGCTYGGNGSTTFALPDLQGRVPVGMGSGVGLTVRNLGAKDGKETVILNPNQMPIHSHNILATTAVGTTNTPGADKMLATPPSITTTGSTIGKPINIYAPVGTAVPLASGGTAASAGNGQAHDNMMPYNVINYIICISGIFPTRQ